jgi:hypothetical protein
MHSWVILFSDLADLQKFLSENGKISVPGTLDKWLNPPLIDAEGENPGDILARHLSLEKLKRIYFGVEFCQRLIPKRDKLEKAVGLTQQAGLSFSFLTPPVTDSGLEILEPCLKFLHEKNSSARDIEIIVNDWGTLRILHEKFTGLEPVLGRMMNKMIRDPRLPEFYTASRVTGEGFRAVRQSSLTSRYYRNSMEEWGVKRFEFDNMIQGIDLEEETGDSGVSVYIPYGYVATGRICMPGSLNLDKENKFTEYMGCGKECQEFTHLLEPVDTPDSLPSPRLIQRGNTLFYPNSRAIVKTVFTDYISGMIDRIVYQPRLPI